MAFAAPRAATESAGRADPHLIFIRGCSTGRMKQRDTGLARRIRERDSALRRLRRTTVLAFAGTAGLAVAFGGLAAKAFPGHSHGAASAQRPPHVAVRPAARHVAVTPPPLVPADTPAAPAAPPPPPPPPVVTQAPPVAVSGGS